MILDVYIIMYESCAVGGGGGGSGRVLGRQEILYSWQAGRQAGRHEHD